MSLLSSPESSHRFPKILALLILTLTAAATAHSKCELFDAIFNFGDSNSDTGGFWAVFPAPYGPYGMTFFNKPTGRATDGRLILDFLAESLGLPFISPYLKSIGSDFRHGANFATLASTVLLPNTSLFVTGTSPFSLAIQLNQFKEFKLRVDEYYSSSSSQPKGWGMQLPPPNIFGKALYTFYIGQNDFTSNLKAIGIEGVQQYLPQVVSQIVDTIKEVYKLGGRSFIVMNMAPVGCYPALLVELFQQKDIDEYGCLISYNKAVRKYNSMLHKHVNRARKTLPNASLVYFDTHSVLLQLFQHPISHGLKYGTKACCGYGGDPYNFDPRVICGNSKKIKKSMITATACKDPYNYVSWDGIHATEAANKILTLAILNGSYSHPPFSLHNLYHLQPLH